MHALVHAADVQDRDGGALVMATLFGSYPFLMKLYADGGYQGPGFRLAVKEIMAGLNVEIVKRSDQAKAFSSCPNVGSSSAPSPGSEDVEGSQRTGNASIARASLSSASPLFASCCESFATPHNVLGRTLRYALS